MINETIDQQIESIDTQKRFLADCINGGLMVYHCKFLISRLNSRREKLVEKQNQLLFAPSADLDEAALAT